MSKMTFWIFFFRERERGEVGEINSWGIGFLKSRSCRWMRAPELRTHSPGLILKQAPRGMNPQALGLSWGKENKNSAAKEEVKTKPGTSWEQSHKWPEGTAECQWWKPLKLEVTQRPANTCFSEVDPFSWQCTPDCPPPCLHLRVSSQQSEHLGLYKAIPSEQEEDSPIGFNNGDTQKDTWWIYPVRTSQGALLQT